MKEMSDKKISLAVLRLALVTAMAATCLAGCGEDTTRYYSRAQLLRLEKFQGYDFCKCEYWTNQTGEYLPWDGPLIDGPWRLVAGVNFDVPREVMTPLERELDFDGKTWRFRCNESNGYGFRLLAVGNEKGEVTPIILRTVKEVPTWFDQHPDLQISKDYQKSLEEKADRDERRKNRKGEDEKGADDKSVDDKGNGGAN